MNRMKFRQFYHQYIHYIVNKYGCFVKSHKKKCKKMGVNIMFAPTIPVFLLIFSWELPHYYVNQREIYGKKFSKNQLFILLKINSE